MRLGGGAFGTMGKAENRKRVSLYVKGAKGWVL